MQCQQRSLVKAKIVSHQKLFPIFDEGNSLFIIMYGHVILKCNQYS